MRKNILLLGAILLTLPILAQTETYITETGGENNPVVYIDANYPDQGPCGPNISSNAFENGKSCTLSLNRIVANDFEVPVGEDLTLESLTVNVFIGAEGSGVNASFVDIYYYSDSNGEPGSVIGSELNLIPWGQVVVGSNFGFDVWQLELNVPDVVFHGQGGSPKTYWIGLSIEATDGSNLFWENTTVDLEGYGEAYDDGMGGNFEMDATLDGVYFMAADCDVRLGIDDNFVDGVKLYPNPVTDGIVNITSPISSEMQVVVFDVSGKKVIESVLIGDRQLNVSTLNSGMYMLQLTQEGVSVIKKLAIR